MAKNNGQYAVETFSLTKNFTDWWGRNKVVAVDNLSLQVRHNEVFGLLGPNGSGKTTVLKMLLSLLHPTKGKAMVLGGDSRNPKITSQIGFLPEESYLYQYLNARETLNFYGTIFGLNSKVRKARTEALLEMVGLAPMAKRPVGTFSKGMARRIGLAVALINDPKLLILDEPTSGLDPIGTKQVKDLIIELAKRGKTILLCSHLLADVEDICDRIAILYGGRIQRKGLVKELLQQSDKTQILAEKLKPETIEKIKSVFNEAQVDYRITSPMEKLETFFIDIVHQAQFQKTPTSGVINAEEASEIDSQVSVVSNVLDKLVSAPVNRAEIEEKQTEAVSTANVPKQDSQLLSDLTKGPEPTKSKPVETEKVEPKTTEDKKTQVKKDVLDQLLRDDENRGNRDA